MEKTHEVMHEKSNRIMAGFGEVPFMTPKFHVILQYSSPCLQIIENLQFLKKNLKKKLVQTKIKL